jgi:hypothetical protein
MSLHFGTKLMGKVDEVPRMGYVSTQFFHVNYLPIIPTGTYFVLEESGDNFRGVTLPLSFKSILVAWLRAILFLAFIVAVFVAIIAAADEKMERAIGAGVGGVFAVVAFWCSYYIPLISRASYQRAMDLAGRIGLNEEAVLMLEVAYGRKSAAEADLELEQIEQRRETAMTPLESP